jgi:hypothetical protein
MSNMTDELAQDLLEMSKEELMNLYAIQTAKTSLELYLTEGLTAQDYSMTYQILSQALLYVQNNRDEK